MFSNTGVLTWWVCETCLSVGMPMCVYTHTGCQRTSSNVCTWFCGQATTAKIHYPLPSVMTTEFYWFILPGAPAQYAATFLPARKWSCSERWLTLFCPCLLILQIGLSQHLICWRLSYIYSTVLLVDGNLGYLVRLYESLYCAEQGHFPLCLCLLSI